jgi:predicted ATPase
MALSKEVRRLDNKWRTGGFWPKRLEYLDMKEIRGWEGQRLDFTYPFMTIVGENGSGKSSILQAIASVYQSPDDWKKTYYASDFFPDTPWEQVTDAKITFSVREGDKSIQGSVRKQTTRWRGNPQRRKRDVYYIDLRRTQPIATQVGFSRLTKPQFKEIRREDFQVNRLGHLSSIIGREYQSARYSLTDADAHRWVPVVNTPFAEYSAFHQGAGETTVIELMRYDFKPYSILLIDELETSLHPRSQRRLIRYLAEQCREKELQIIVTTHSPYVIKELPVEARVYIMRTHEGREFVTGVSPEFALTKMDEEAHPELDVYVEDEIAGIMFEEIVAANRLPALTQCEVIPYGAASVGKALGLMVHQNRFPRKSIVFLDGDQETTEGCLRLPGDDAPERVVFEALKKIGWQGVAARINRKHVDLVDASESAMTATNHRDWLRLMANQIIIGGHELWRAMCIVWAAECLSKDAASEIVQALDDAINIRGVALPGRLFTAMDYLPMSRAETEK